MFILSDLILEAGQNLFRDFWSPFSISFYFSSARNYLKKRAPPLGRARAGLRSGAAYIKRHPRRPSPPDPVVASRRRQPPPPDPADPAARTLAEVRRFCCQ